jgi:methylthioribose-1-phosphate isomerase|tara:strand:+ start:119 stop:325 length:207 start_codon:yes stop_codon:yes gene_type:complete
MALDNSEVLKNLQEQLVQVQQQLETGRATALRLQGAIEVLQQIEDSKVETPETEVVDGGEVEAPPAEG